MGRLTQVCVIRDEDSIDVCGYIYPIYDVVTSDTALVGVMFIFVLCFVIVRHVISIIIFIETPVSSIRVKQNQRGQEITK